MEFKVNDLCFEYNKNQEILKDVSFSFNEGDIVAVLGINGAGKSTLIKCLASIFKPKSGSIILDNEDLTKLNPTKRAQLISYVPQSIFFNDLSVYDSILIGRKPYIKFEPTKDDLKIIEDTIVSLNLENLAFKNVNHLSGGEKQKVAIARALVQESKVILLDEPTSNLDIKNQLEVINLIKKTVKEHQLIALNIVHDINLALKLANKFLLLKGGKVYKCGDIDVINESNLDTLYDVNSKVFNINDTKFVILNEKEEKNEI